MTTSPVHRPGRGDGRRFCLGHLGVVAAWTVAALLIVRVVPLNRIAALKRT